MNSTPDPAGRDEQLRRTLHASAAAIDLDPGSPDAIARRGRRRRRHRRLAGGTAVAALALGVVVVATSGSDDSMVSTSDTMPPTDETAPAPGTTEPTATTAAPAPVPTAPVTTASPSPTTPVEPSAPVSGVVVVEPVDADAPTEQPGRLVPFGDGFAMVTTSSVSTPLPERLPAEIRDLFSPEVIELFADGLPPSIEEASRILQDAGLLDEVSQVLADHPEAYDAIYGSTVATSIDVWSTIDGVSWTRAGFPGGPAFPEATVSSGRLVSWSMTYDSDGVPSGVTIATSDDLANWQLTDVDLGDDRTLPDHVTHDRWVDTVAIVGDRWYALVSSNIGIDWLALLPPSLQDEIGDDGFGLSYDDAAVTVDVATADGLVSRTFTFEELGLPADGLVDVDRGPASTLLTGSLDGAAPTEELDLPGPPAMTNTRALITIDDGRLLYVGDAVYLSDDGGRTWARSADLPDGTYVETAMPLGDDVLLLGYGPDPTPVLYRWTTDGDLTALSAPALDGGYSLWDNRASPAWVVESWQEPVLAPVEFELDHNGFHYAIVDDHETFTFLVTDAATGEVLIDRVVPSDERDELYASVSGGEQEFVSVIDDAGVELDQLPSDLLVDAYLNADTGPAEAAEFGANYVPDLWLVATADGEAWLTRQLGGLDVESGAWVGATAAANGDRLLVFDGSTWSVETLP